MFLKNLRLENFRCFENIELSFTNENGSNRKWTVLLGENGMGKSNLLKAIGLVTAGSDALSDLLGEPNDWIKYGKSYCKIEAILVTKGKQEREIKLHINKDDSRSKVIIQNRDSLQALDNAIEHTERNYFVVGFGGSRRVNLSQSRRSKGSIFHGRAQNVASLFDTEALLNPIESWAMDLDYQDKNNGIQTVQKVLNSFLPGVTFSRIDKSKGKLLFKTPDGEVAMQQLSDGYQNVAGWVGDLLYRITETFKDYHSPLKARGLLLIDEIALHLHIRWQRNLLDFINKKLPNFQLVVTTHSPVTAQQANEGDLYYLQRQNKRIQVLPFSGNPKNLLLNQLITADLFGLESDESREVEAKKTKYKKLRDKKQLSKKEKNDLKNLVAELNEVPARNRGNLVSEKKHIDLLKKIDKELSGKK